MIYKDFSLSAQASLHEEVEAELAMMTPSEIEIALAHCGVFQETAKKSKRRKRRCTRGLAGYAANLHIEAKSSLAVKEFLGIYKAFLEDSIHDLEADQATEAYREIINTRSDLVETTRKADRLVARAQSYASGIELHDWSKRVPDDAKRAFTLIGFASQCDSFAITFRLSHKVAQAALAAKRPTEYLAALLKRAGLTDIIFVLEFSDSESDENHPLHIHGVAIIPAALLDGLSDRLRKLLAHDYRQRGDNKAIDIRPLVTPAKWTNYITKHVAQTAAKLSNGRAERVSPYYASRIARRAGRDFYEEIQRLTA